MLESKSNNLDKLREQIRIQQEQIQDYERLHRVLQSICSSMQVDEILQRIIEEAVNLSHAQQGSIMLFDPKREQEAKTLVRQGEAGTIKLDHYLNTLLAGWISHHKKSLLTDDLIKTFGEKRLTKKYREISSAMSIPLELHGEIIGVINLITLTDDSIFGDRQLELIHILASQCTQFIANARLHEELFVETQRLRNELKDKYAFQGIIGNSPKMQEVFALLERIIPTDGRVLIEGESGTGKELIARVIHYGGPRKDSPFIAVDCGALPANLLESELFGYVKGAFTGALHDKKGLFVEADGGTLFLDEIANLPSELQAKFLRAIQENEFRPLGSTQLKKVDVRIITAASDNLRAQVETGTFREDLFYRLNVVNISLPPLRQRKEDVAILANHFLSKFTNKYGKKILGFKPETVSCFEAYTWPGNIRELENIVERLVILAEQNLDYITIDLLPPEIRAREFESAISTLKIEPSHDMKSIKEAYEKEMLIEALKRHNWNQSSAANELGVHEKTVRNKMKKFHIKKS